MLQVHAGKDSTLLGWLGFDASRGQNSQELNPLPGVGGPTLFMKVPHLEDLLRVKHI